MHWPAFVCLTLETAWSLSGALCLALAAALLLRPQTAAGLERWSLRARWLPAAALGVCLPAALALFKLAQFHSYELMFDSGVMGNLAWNAGHGYGLTSSVIADRCYLGVHFEVLMALFSPVLWVWESTAALAVLQGLALGSSILALYLATRRLVRDPLAPWLISLLAMSQPFFHDLAGATVNTQIYAVPLFLWSLVLWTSGRQAAAVALGALILTTREEAPFLLFGLGLLAAWKSWGGRRWPGWLIMASAILLWSAEVLLIRHEQAGWAQAPNYWGSLYGGLGDSLDSVLKLSWTRPWRFAAALALPPSKLLTPLSVLLSLGLLPLNAGALLLPIIVVWLPHQLAAPVEFHRLTCHYSAFIFGPLLLAAACGLGKALDRAQGRPRRLLLVWVLAVAGTLFLRSSDFLLPPGLIPSSWREAAPRALAQIPAEAKVWCDEFFLPHLGMRRYIKVLPRQLPDPFFEPGLFVPDRVLVSRHWIRLAGPAASGRILGFLRRKGLRTVFEEKDLMVLSRPGAGGPAEPAAIP